MNAPYRVSSLAFAFVRMWRGWQIIVPVIVLNALIQALLIWPPFTYGSGVWTVLSAVVSAIVVAAAFAAIAASALKVADGPVRWVDVVPAVRENATRFIAWTLVWGVAVAIGFALYVAPGMLIIGLTPFLTIAVLDGQVNPLRANFEVIRSRLGRWLITIIIVMVFGVIFWVIAGFTAFFLRGPIATLLVLLVGGWLASWFVTAFGLIYRGARASESSMTAACRGAGRQ